MYRETIWEVSMEYMPYTARLCAPCGYVIVYAGAAVHVCDVSLDVRIKELGMPVVLLKIVGIPTVITYFVGYILNLFVAKYNLVHCLQSQLKELSKEIDIKAKYDSQRARKFFIRCEE